MMLPKLEVNVARKYKNNGVDAKNQKRIKLKLFSFNILLNSNNKNTPTDKTKNSKKI